MCRGEAPDVERFARENKDKLTVIGLGTQDTFPEAQEFVSTYGTRSFLMAWDPSGQSWAHFGVTGQPAVALLDPDGKLIEGWYGPIPEDEVLELAEQSA